MRIARLTQANNPFLLALILLLQLIPMKAMKFQQLSPNPLRNHNPLHKRMSRNQLDDTDDFGGNDTGGDFDCGKNDTSAPKCGMKVSTNPKQTATNIAQKAAQEAEQAYGTQQSAAAEVAQKVKMQLADKAYAAAKAAEAAMGGKQQIVEQIASELCEAESSMEQERALLPSYQDSVNFSSLTAQQAQQVLLSLQKSIKMAKQTVDNAQHSAIGAQQQLGEKVQLIEAAQQRVVALRKQLLEARKDLENIKKFAYKAVCAATEARQKAEREQRMKRRHPRKKRQQIQAVS